jgi:pimeloyl-ACP methyl ester carboxylesterase
MRRFHNQSIRACHHFVDNLVYFNTLEKGGHFAAFEQPEVFVEEVRKGFRHAR